MTDWASLVRPGLHGLVPYHPGPSTAGLVDIAIRSGWVSDADIKARGPAINIRPIAQDFVSVAGNRNAHGSADARFSYRAFIPA